jgi:VWFA-related protein
VNVLATVRNSKGEIVRDLTKDDFSIEEDGLAQTIRYFSRETDLPLTLGLLVDVSASQRRVLGEERHASTAFLDQVLREDRDQAFLIQFEREVELLKDLTSSRKALESAVNSLDAPELQRAGGGSGGGRSSGGGYPGRGGGGGGYPGGRRGGAGRGGTSLYDAVFLASNDVLQKQSGRKAVIVLSDGVDNASKTSLTEAVESAQRADILVYSILFADEQQQGMGGFGPGMGRGGGRGRGRAAGCHKNPELTARRSSSGSLERPAELFSKYRRSIPSMRSISASRRSCAVSTAWVTPRSGLPAEAATARFTSRQSKKVLRSKPATVTTPEGSVRPKSYCSKYVYPFKPSS